MKMKKTKEELKELALAAIDQRREDIFALGDSIYEEPELGYKEFKTAQKVKNLFDDLGIAYEDELALTGIKARISGRSSQYNVGVMAELDSVISPQHPDADPLTGAVHACGHNCMVAALAGLAYALKDTDLMDHLDGDVTLLAVPAEEFVELGYRRQLMEEGKIHFMGGKQEFIRQGVFDDIDISVMQHTFASENPEYGGIVALADASANGFIGQEIEFLGQEAHAGSSPDLGVNALDAAALALVSINAQRTTFREEDYIRVHPIISHGGDIVNTVPARVTLESYVRGANVPAILQATDKVNRCWEAGALAMGAEVQIRSLAGYLPQEPNKELSDLMYENLLALFGEDQVVKCGPHQCGSSDVGDVASILPTIQARIGGAAGNFHGDNYRLVNRDLAYLGAAKALVMMVIDLLYDGGREAARVLENFQPIYSKEEYLREWGGLSKKD